MSVKTKAKPKATKKTQAKRNPVMERLNRLLVKRAELDAKMIDQIAKHQKTLDDQIMIVKDQLRRKEDKH